MTAGRWQQIKAIFDLAVEIPQLRLEVQTLLDADQNSIISVMQPLALLLLWPRFLPRFRRRIPFSKNATK